MTMGMTISLQSRSPAKAQRKAKGFVFRTIAQDGWTTPSLDFPLRLCAFAGDLLRAFV
jgi:hypothetical protein